MTVIFLENVKKILKYIKHLMKIRPVEVEELH